MPKRRNKYLTVTQKLNEDKILFLFGDIDNQKEVLNIGYRLNNYLK